MAAGHRHTKGQGLAPLLPEALYTLLHPRTIFLQLLIGGRCPALPFTHNTIRMKQGVERLGKQWSKTVTVTLQEKVSFIAGVLNIKK
jgi:hypothetical protein